MLFYRILNRMICANLLLLNHLVEIEFRHAKILYCIGKTLAFNGGSLIQNKIISQALVTNLRVGLSYGCLLTKMILATMVSLSKDAENVKHESDLGKEKISRSFIHSTKG